jgi:hypothetical protein
MTIWELECGAPTHPCSPEATPSPDGIEIRVVHRVLIRLADQKILTGGQPDPGARLS